MSIPKALNATTTNRDNIMNMKQPMNGLADGAGKVLNGDTYGRSASSAGTG